MGATTTPTTFLDLYNDLLNRVRVQQGTTAADTTSLNYARRYINQALHDVHIQQNWPWAERNAVLQTHATYTTGTVAIALATRTTVTGTDTLWNTAVTGMGFNNARAGGKMTFAGASDVYTVSTVGDDTTITLADRFIGSTALTASTYTYYEDEYALASDFFRLVDARQFSSALTIPVVPRRDFYARYARNNVTGLPRNCTIVELGPSGSVSPRQRVIFHPAPDAVYNIPYRYITSNLAVSSAGTGAANLSSDTDEPIIPVKYRHVLVEYGLYIWYRDFKDDQRAEAAKAQYESTVARMANDVEPGRDRPRFVARRWIYHAGTAGPRRTGDSRFGTGSAFDEMRD